MNFEIYFVNPLVGHWIKAGLILGLTWMFVRIGLRKRSASAQHAVWLIGIAAALILPLASAVLPDWRVLPAAEREKVVEGLRTRSSSLAMDRGLVPSTETQDSGILANSATTSTPDKARIERSLPGWPTVLFAIWLSGALLILGRIFAAWTRLAIVSRRSNPFESSLTEIETRTSPEISIPLVWGCGRSTILLPTEAETWPKSRLRSVLLHESAHARRRDPLIQIFLEIARAALWLQPLIWIAIRKLRAERESACDDAVLESGVSPKAYAADLLDIVSQHVFRIPTAALAMACPSTLETRVRGVLDSSRVRSRASSCWWAATSAAAFVLVGPLAMLTAEQKEQATQENPQKDLPKEKGLWTAMGVVNDSDGKPMAGVEIKAFCGNGTLRRAGLTTTGEDGRYELMFGPGGQGPDGVPIEAATIYASKPGFYEIDLCRAGDCIAAGAVPDGFPLENNPWGATRERLFVPGEAKELNFTLAPAKTLNGRLEDADGEVAGRKIWLTGPDLPPSTSVLAVATTDKGGRFTFEGIPTKFGYSLIIPDGEAGKTGWSLGPLFFKDDAAPIAMALAENDAPMLAEELIVELVGKPRADFEKQPSSRSGQAQGGASIQLRGGAGGAGIRIGGPDGLRIQGQGSMRSKRLKITLGGAGGGAINLAP
ncbi:MAG: beta-lactamase regulating signal transducer with metallopeptidase domain [Verrucomicrobiales bacterium]|jgi:beta-lactamase regulating signal transducer with metallopeptidase domain